MSTLREKIIENMRLTILRLLGEQGGYRLNQSTMTMALRDLGFEEPTDVITAELAFLERHQLVTLEEPMTGVTVATLTTKGDEVRMGLMVYPGVKRPAARG